MNVFLKNKVVMNSMFLTKFHANASPAQVFLTNNVKMVISGTRNAVNVNVCPHVVIHHKHGIIRHVIAHAPLS